MKKFFKRTVVFLTVFTCLIAVIGCSSSSLNKKETPLVFDSANVQGTLDNGMTYFVRHNEEPKNRIILRLVVKAGSNMEDEDQKGVAHFIEHLAFNGTEHFQKSAIVDYFEKIGMDFGSDLNAYTSFDETVYKLEIPADNEEVLKTSLLILKDWACGITFPPEEIEKERGVVTEEWRLRQGLQGRVTNKVISLLLKGSRYEQRVPIGDMDIIHNIGRDRIMDFYNKWYRPELMSVIAVGDIDEKVLENAVKEVMADIKPSEDSIEHPVFEVPVTWDKTVEILKDSEQKYEIIQMFLRREDYKECETVEELRRLSALEIGRSAFNERLTEMTNNPDSNWLEAFASDVTYTHTSAYEYQGIVPKSNCFGSAFIDFLNEYDRFVIYGITSSEMERIKTAVITSLEQEYKNKDKITSNSYADNLVGHFITGKIIISAEDAHEILTEIIQKITLEEINEEIKKYYTGRGSLMLVQAPDFAEDVPDAETIKEYWENYESEVELTAYEEEDINKPLMERPSKKGKVVSKQEISEMDVKEYIFENGIRVLTKKTDFVENQIQLYAVSMGGYYALPEKDYPSARYSSHYRLYSGFGDFTYNQFIKSLSTKNVSIDYDIGLNTEYFSGSATHEDFETLLQIAYQIFTDFKFTDDAWDLIKVNIEETAKNHGLQPRDVFVDSIIETLYGDDIYHSPINMKFVEKMDSKTAAKAFKSRFENPADFTFIFIGDMDEEELIDQLSYYLGSMKTSDKREKLTYKLHDFPEDVIQKTVYKGIDEQGQVFIGFGGYAEDLSEDAMEQKYYEDFMATQLNSLLDIWLRESIREDKSGCYGIGSFGGLEGITKRSFEYEVNFGCDPKRAEELTQEVLKQIRRLQTEEIPEDYILKLQETLRRTRETNLRNNDWWLSRIMQQLVYKTQPIWVSQDIEKIASWITAEKMQEQANKYLDTENYVSVFLKPEK